MSAFLILLLLSNSSLALEVLTHASHQHADPELSQHAMHSADGLSAQMQAPLVDGMQHGTDECSCDDICCLSSIDFGLTVSDDNLPLIASALAANPNFYRSISLDLFLPPPTH